MQNEPEYKALLKTVYHWSSSPHRWGKDTGIDLTAEAHDGTLWAIQAKAYDANYYVTKHDVDKFLSESGRQPVHAAARDQARGRHAAGRRCVGTVVVRPGDAQESCGHHIATLDFEWVSTVRSRS